MDGRYWLWFLRMMSRQENDAAIGSNDVVCLNATSGLNNGSVPNVTSGPNEGVDKVFYGELNDADGIIIKTLVTEHQCSITFKNKRANYKLVVKHVLSKFRIVPKLNIVEMQNLGGEEIKVELTKHTCIKARKWALEKISDSVALEFNRLFDYVFALRSTDPTGTFELMVERPTEAKIQDIVCEF
ncbi:hypothetical protein V6N11_008669 [Hibiscus sabdariffa]|uniref:Uncharacterized protein n=2 Tax=Hibiscus sabdariffa TaxID=183260 RepID=A0ABR2AHQ2_9ROSI